MRNLFLVVVILFTLTLGAQNYEIDRITISDGLPSNSIESFYIDQNGIVWIYSPQGIYKFDGAQFTSYNLLSNPKIGKINKIKRDFNNQLWMADENHLQVLNLNQNKIVLTLTLNFVIQDFLIIDSANVWVLGSELYKFKNNVVIEKIPIPKKGSQYIIGKKIHNQLYTICDLTNGFAVGNIINNKFTSNYNINANLICSGKQTYAVKDEKLFLLKDNGIEEIDRLPFLKNSEFNAQLNIDKQNRIWFILNKQKIVLYDITKKQITVIEKELNGDKIFDSQIDKYGNIWICGNNGFIIFKHKNNAIQDITINNTTSKFGCRKIIQIDDYYLATYDNKLTQFYANNHPFNSKINILIGNTTLNTSTNYNIQSGEKYTLNGINSFHENIDIIIDSTSIWACGFGLHKLSLKNKIGQIFFLKDKTGNIQKIKDNLCLIKNKNKIYIGNSHNFFVFNLENNYYTEYTDCSGKPFFEGHTIWDLCLINNVLYIGSNYGLYSIDVINNCVNKIELKYLNLPINSLYYDKKNILWIGTNGYGLIEYNLKSQITTQYNNNDGLSCNTISSVFADKKNRLWISTYYGLNYFNQNSHTFINYYVYDGLLNNELNRKAFYVQNDGQIIVGGITGYNIFNPDLLLRSTDPMHILLLQIQVRIGQKKPQIIPIENTINPIEFNSETDQLDITFTLDNFFGRKNHKYYYKIDGIDNIWHFLGSKQVLSISKLPPGKYHVQIKAAFKNGQFSENVLTIPIKVTALFYKTWWFFALIFLCIIGFFFFLYRYRILQLKRMNQLRTKLASDLHDEVGGNLVQIAMLTENLKYTDEEEKTEMHDKIAEISRDAVGTMRDVVWSVDSRNDAMENIILKMKEYAHDSLSPIDINYDFYLQKIDPTQKLNISKRQNLFLAFKEIINNIVKHSNCKNVHITLMLKNNYLELKVLDDGTKIDTKKSSGQGLLNIEMRTKNMNGFVEIIKNNGFCVLIKIPMKM